jgi:CTP synthase
MADWAAMVTRMKNVKEKVPIALVGKYVEYPDSYISVREALRHAGLAHDREVDIQWVHSEDVERHGPDTFLGTACGIVVPGGFGPRGVEGMIQTVRYAREHQVPYLGLCLGMQVMVVEWARDVLGLVQANSSELDPDTPHPVIDIMPEQRSVTDLGGTMRLGGYPFLPLENTITMKAYQQPLVTERHRHRFELNNLYRESLESADLIAAGVSPDGRLVEAMELRGSPFMVGVQFHPEFQSRPNRPHPLFSAFVGAAKETIREGGQRPLPLE